MATSVFQKIFRNQLHSAPRIIHFLNKSIFCEQPPLTTAPVLTHLAELETRPRQIPLLAQSETKNLSLNPSHSSQIYPSFCIGLFLNPICSTGLIRLDVDHVVTGDSGTIWADSVKKKRKRKMNKHKLRKLRRRLRKKS